MQAPITRRIEARVDRTQQRTYSSNTGEADERVRGSYGEDAIKSTARGTATEFRGEPSRRFRTPGVSRRVRTEIATCANFAAPEIYDPVFSMSKVPRYCFESHSRLAQFRQANSIPHKLLFTITYKTPVDAVPVTTTFHTLQTFQSYFHGWLFKNPVTNLATLPACMNYSHADSTVVYLAEHPRYIGIAEQLGVFHPQISDKVFEEKAIKAIERHLSLHGDIRRFVGKDPTRQDGWRYLTGETNIAEWDGIWEGPDEHIYFLETKHFVDGNKIVQVDQKLEKSLKFFRKSTQMATTYVAGSIGRQSRALLIMRENWALELWRKTGLTSRSKIQLGGIKLGRIMASKSWWRARNRGGHGK
ncbi:hypothetical protein BS47DRAFT_1384555 [Hydnum rufescens UP504]|uniref:Uncharacterized protein n=1 Tax=Hydnum rufescens UP504 TaxID=1448309 RepID=A0A9P6AQ76_9AGAM|nr:hypothetical protein BS47DRAFT_1384555 [Hydnum rufescens UP504]